MQYFYILLPCAQKKVHPEKVTHEEEEAIKDPVVRKAIKEVAAKVEQTEGRGQLKVSVGIGEKVLDKIERIFWYLREFQQSLEINIGVKWMGWIGDIATEGPKLFQVQGPPKLTEIQQLIRFCIQMFYYRTENHDPK